MKPIHDDEPGERRLEQFIHRQTRMFEIITPFRSVALMVEGSGLLVAAAVKRARQTAILENERTLGPSLKLLSPSQGRKLVTKLHMV